jgi:hypothetical protein
MRGRKPAYWKKVLTILDHSGIMGGKCKEDERVMRSRVIGAAGIGIAVALGALASGGSLRTARAAAPVSSLALKQSDVPAGYKQTVAKNETIQLAATSLKVSVAFLRAKGWVADYQSTFLKSGTKTAIEITSAVTQFKSASGATWDFNNGLQTLRKQYHGSKTFSVSGMGDKATGLTASGKSGKTTFSLVFVVFQRGGYVGGAAIVIGGVGTASASDTQHYASIVDGRVKNS